ncbi:MAG: selenide, water dikinase SelD [Chitinophagales bacterium]
MSETIRLTQFSHGSGCGCKIAPAVLDEILKDSGTTLLPDSNLLVGNETKDDAAVYNLGNGTALISTVDFFMPIVDDAFAYGQIAAANALSDVYAMGGKPFLAIAVLGWPTEKIPATVAREVMRGAKQKCSEAGVTLAGGHTIDSPEPFFGLAVNGMVSVSGLKKNSTAITGDLLFITKPIGTGIISTALKRSLITEEQAQDAVQYMSTLNLFGAELGKYDYVHALTDVTGFGLLGHLIEMCEGAGVSAEIEYVKVPLMGNVKDLAAKFVYADNTMRNWKSYEAKVQGIGSESLLTLCDPQTSGGLLIAVAKDKQNEFAQLCGANDVTAVCIGSITEKKEKAITIL